MNMANTIRLTVGGIEYSVVSEDGEEYIRAIGRELERKMDRLAKQNPFLSTTMVAVLAAMDAMDRQKKTEEQNGELRTMLTEMTEKCTVARRDANEAMRALEELRHREP